MSRDRIGVTARCTNVHSDPRPLAMVLAMLLLGIVVTARPCFAHPMGNFTISHYSGITIEARQVEVHYLIDMAEIPTFQEMQQSGITGRPDDPKLQSYLKAKAADLASRLRLLINDRQEILEPVSQNAIFPPGAGGLLTMKFSFLFRAKTSHDCSMGRCKLTYEDANFPGRAGWKEIVVQSRVGVTIESSTAPDHDRSFQLTNYPTDLVNSPPQDLSASISFVSLPVPIAATSSLMHAAKSASATAAPNRKPSTPSAASAAGALDPSQARVAEKDKGDISPNVQKTPRSAFTELISSSKIGMSVVLIAAFIAAGLGALHALEPGHGKTIVAAYLVGTRGTAWHAVLLGFIVTVTHTAGVYMLGAVTLYAQKYILPEQLFPYLGVLSGILIAGTGCYLFLQRYVGGELIPSHSHGGVVHGQSGIFDSNGSAGLAARQVPTAEAGAEDDKPPLPAYQLFVLGVTGGIVPCPAALVVLLSALALHRILFGLFLIVAFSGGLAFVLIAMGMVAVYAGRVMSRVQTDGSLIQRWLPLTSAAMITALGCVIVVRALMAAGIVRLHA